MSGGGGEEGTTLEFTPTWVVALVCTVIVAISLGVERLLHYGGKYLKKTNQQPLFQALQKIKEGKLVDAFGVYIIAITVFQNRIVKICVAEDIMKHLLPCSLPSESASSGEEGVHASPETETHHRRLLEEATSVGYCSAKDKVPLLSLEATHHLHIFVFVLAIVHVTFSVLTVVFGGIRIRQWKHWEDSTAKDNYRTEQVLKPKITHVHQHDFIKNRFLGVGKRSVILGPLHSFLKQFYGSVTRSDYFALRHGFIMTHCRGNPKFNFHKYMIRALEADFKKVVGISWYLWIFVVVFLLLNINGWHTYFWIAFVPFVLLLAVGTKLEHIISQLANEVAEKHVAVEGELVVKPSDDHFWFGRPRIVLFLIHFILFQNAFEIAFFFWIWVQYGFDSCIMGRVVYIVPRLIIGVFIQVLCSYTTLPLYAIVTQMGTYFKKSIFEEHVQVGILGWAEKAKKNHGGGGGLKGALGAAAAKGKNPSTTDDSSDHVQKRGLKGAFSAASAKGNTPSTTNDSSEHVQMGDLGHNEPRRPDV